MAEIEAGIRKKTAGVKRCIKKRLGVDLTPMVDLGFLLITFFILTTSLSKPAVSQLLMPKDSPATTPVCESCTITLLLQGDNKLYYYEGISGESNLPLKTTFSSNGLRKLLQQKQQKVFMAKGTKQDMILIIKPGKESSYKNLMDMLDEVSINDIKHYYIDTPDKMDEKALANMN
ncbi:ExbD/TolR family protein [Ferruginibacter albus]|uniref:ExbD/TolR family protein n=1 Tax=Ferruginibacter albus TaxID=2875540 RepID=UPI001CC7B38B|nr:biopolymer transporter ExbD [Ferruginibacter albus]UAY51565.1 biopolymer transporter ExbD [Ferruginibacter albus]